MKALVSLDSSEFCEESQRGLNGFYWKKCFTLCQFFPLGMNLLAGSWELGTGLPHCSSAFEGRGSRECPVFMRSLRPMAEGCGFGLQYVTMAVPIRVYGRGSKASRLRVCLKVVFV